MLSNMPNPYAAPQTRELQPALPTNVLQEPRLEPELITGPTLCLKAVVLLLASIGLTIAAVLLKFDFFLLVILIMIAAAAVCHLKGLVHLMRADANQGTSALFALSLVTFILALILKMWLSYIAPILNEQTSPTTGWVQQIFSLLSYGRGLIRVGKTQNQSVVVWCASTALVMLASLTIASAILTDLPGANPPPAQVIPFQMAQPSIVVGVLILLAAIVGLAAYMLALWFIRKAGSQASWRGDLLSQLHGLQEQAKKVPDEAAT
jgi:hypothetical protein